MMQSIRCFSGHPVRALGKVLREGVLAPQAPLWLRAPSAAPSEAPCQRATLCRAAQDQFDYDGGADGGYRTPINELVIGQVYTGTVKSIVNFGAFVDIGSTSDGLVHISEISDQYVRDVNEYVSRGDQVDVVLLKVVGEQKLSLSMKAALAQGGGDY